MTRRLWRRRKTCEHLDRVTSLSYGLRRVLCAECGHLWLDVSNTEEDHPDPLREVAVGVGSAGASRARTRASGPHLSRGPKSCACGWEGETIFAHLRDVFDEKTDAAHRRRRPGLT